MTNTLAPQQSQTFAVTARKIKKNYGQGDAQVHALDNVDISFERGKFTAIMGPSGSGKSTLMHVLAGLDTIDSGDIYLGENRISTMNDAELTKLRRESVGFVFQSFNLVPTLSAEQNMRLPLELANTSVEQDWFDYILDTLGLRSRLNHKPHELSGGQQQRVAVGRALLTKPEVIFADEPTGNLDSTVGGEVLSLLRRSSREFGQSIIMVTHDPIAASYADQVVLLSDGKIAGHIAEPTPENVLATLSTLGA